MKGTWSEVAKAFRKGQRDEQVRAAELSTCPPTSRQLDLASKVQQALKSCRQGGQLMLSALLTSKMGCEYAFTELAEVSSK